MEPYYLTTLKEKELVEALSTIRTLGNLITQLVTVLIVGNITILGFAFDKHNPWVFLLGSVCPFLILIIRYVCYKSMIPSGFFVYQIENEANDTNTEYLAHLYLNSSDKGNALKFDEILKTKDFEERHKKLSDISSFWNVLFSPENRTVSVVCVLAFLPQLIFPLIKIIGTCCF